MSRVDVAVVGGGPAGATAARRLAQAGVSVRVFESESTPRYKTCGGGLVGRARRWLEVDLGPVVEAECRRAEMRFLDAGLSFGLAAEEPLVTMTMRAELDHALLEAARAAGAQVLTDCAVGGLEQSEDEVRLTTAGGRHRARFVVAADGASGRVARWGGWRRQPRCAAALESEVVVAPGMLDRFAGRALFDFGVVAQGYAWVFPKRRHLSVGCLSARPGARGLKSRLEAYLERQGIEPRQRLDRGFVIPLAPRAPDLVRGRVLLTGDSAGLADPVTGEGISYAALSGRLAARAIVDGFREPRAVARLYQRLLGREILGELTAARFLAWLLYDRPAATAFLLRRAGGSFCRAMGEILSGRSTYLALAGAPANYLRLLRRLGGSPPPTHQLIRYSIQ